MKKFTKDRCNFLREVEDKTGKALQKRRDGDGDGDVVVCCFFLLRVRRYLYGFG